MDLSCRYMGLAMPNPIAVSSSNLTANIEGVRKAADAGAGAVVLKSLFEEDIAAGVEKSRSAYPDVHPEAAAYIEQMEMMLDADAYLEFVERASAELDIPVIASLNCYSEDWWADYAARIEKVGADAIELNLSPMAMDPKDDAKRVEDRLVGMVALARRTVKLPLAVKIGQHYSSLPNIAVRLEDSGANALTLFNRFFKLDIDIDNIDFKAGKTLSTREEFGPVLRWVGILSDMTGLDISASTGIYDAADIIKVILAGGDVAQLCSVLIREGMDVIPNALEGLKDWMGRHGFETIDAFRSKLSLDDDQRNGYYHRLQYVKAFRKD